MGKTASERSNSLGTEPDAPREAVDPLALPERLLTYSDPLYGKALQKPFGRVVGMKLLQNLR